MTRDNLDIHHWFRRTVGQWTSERRYLYNLKTKKPSCLTTEFTIAPQSEGEYDYSVVWTGQTNGTMNLKLIGTELHRDIGYFSDEPTVSYLSMIDRDTLLMSTSYNDSTFREEIRLLHGDQLRLRQTVGYSDRTGQPIIVGQYYEERL